MEVIAAAYIRVSTDEQADHGISIPAQKSRLIAYCQAQGWKIYRFFIDDGFSGKNLDRPAIKMLLDEAGVGNFNTVVVLKLDRLSRRQKDVLYLLEDVFEPLNLGFRSATETFETTTPFGKAALGMMAVFAQLERETIVERVKLAKKESARQGRFMGGPAPFGYLHNSEKKSLEIDEIPAQIIRQIYESYLGHGRGYQDTAKELERQGVPGPSSLRWSKNYIRKILANPVYAGLIGHKGALYPGRHPHIIEPEKWHEVQSLMREKGTVWTAADTDSGFLSGIIWCGQCGARMRSKNVWQNYPCAQPKRIIRYYVCYSQDGSSRHMVRKPGCKCGYKRAGEIEKKVIGELMGFDFQQDLLYQVAEELLTKNINVKEDHQLSQAAKNLAQADKKLERWFDAFEKGAIDADELAVRVNYLRERKSYLQKRLYQLESSQKEDATREVNIEEILALLKSFPAIWEEATTTERREIVVNLVKAVYVYHNNGVQVEFNAK